MTVMGRFEHEHRRSLTSPAGGKKVQKRANMPWWGGFDSRVWLKSDPWFDVLVPVVFSIAIGVIARGRERLSAASHNSD